jgi:hypothetical protein
MPRHHALKTELTRLSVQVRPDLALFERGDKDAIRAPRQEFRFG